MEIDELVKLLKTDADTVDVACEAMGIAATYRIVEGDRALRDHDVLTYASERVAIANAATKGVEPRRGLIAIESNGRILRWQRGKTLEYCVWRPSFTAASEYDDVVRSVARACADWSGICGARFSHRADLDNEPAFKPNQDVFAVLRAKGGGTTIALAFFPDWKDQERVVWIRDGYFAEQPVFDPVGVLRHELGHVLGFRHEHIAPEAAHLFNPEDSKHIKPLTPYDKRSVMHYLGVGVGDRELQFTEHDRTGAATVYGLPDSRFTFVG